MEEFSFQLREREFYSGNNGGEGHEKDLDTEVSWLDLHCSCVSLCQAAQWTGEREVREASKQLQKLCGKKIEVLAIVQDSSASFGR